MSLTRADSDLAIAVRSMQDSSTTLVTCLSTSSTVARKSSEVVNSSSSIRTTQPTTSTATATTTYNASLSTLTTSTVSATSSMTSGLSTSSTAITAMPRSTSIEWGPAITASVLPAAQTGASNEAVVHPAKHGFNALSKGQKHATIATTAIVGFLIVVSLIYVLCRRHKGATFREILHFRQHHPSTIRLSSGPQDERLTALPIYRVERYSVRSSMHPSMLGTSRPMSHANRSASVPPQVAQRFHEQNPYVKHTWKTIDPPAGPKTPTRAGQSFLVDATPPPSHLSESDRAQRKMSWQSAQSRMTQPPSGEMPKSGLAISVQENPAEDASATSPPDSPNSQQNLKDRWSWTNSQAPPTPRMYAHSLRSSISTLPRFRSIKSWVTGQRERIVEDEQPITSHATKMAILRNKASHPTLAPPVALKLSKSHGRPARLSATYRQRQDSRPSKPMSPRVEEQQLDSAFVSEMSGRSERMDVPKKQEAMTDE